MPASVAAAAARYIMGTVTGGASPSSPCSLASTSCTPGDTLMRRSLIGLLDAALPADDVAKTEAVIDRYRAEDGVGLEALRTRESRRQRFVYVIMTVPAGWTVKRAHHITERLEADMERALPGSVTFVHVEPG
jgi:divalent metal cation (Fe/Co/Zn/Cd) transporter